MGIVKPDILWLTLTVCTRALTVEQIVGNTVKMQRKNACRIIVVTIADRGEGRVATTLAWEKRFGSLYKGTE